ncbi:copper ion binding protein [Shimazuella sp. AN120528]|uniref:heavy-metal-associated domain-containing protein n=1 Tax=Shimazuella soli TaxID=1892854 RepID=UPI001F0E134E|nr:copper ion binding protein [Shimazuella soli]MCH5585380.1 copper ion binding protein [Shimazuella soli]
MSKILLSVNGMSCQHCVRAIKQAVGALKGTNTVVVDLNKQEVSVSFDEQQLEIEQIVDAILEEGYEVGKKQLVGV